MSKLSALAVVILIGGPAFWAQSSSTPQLPDAPMKDKVTTACTECHEARIILQQRLGKEAWSKEVDKMTKWGAVVEPGDRNGFIDYLSSKFPQEKAPYEAPRMKK